MTKNKKRQPTPLAPPAMKSRKRARQVTTLFHKNTRALEQARKNKEEEAILRYEQLVNEGRPLYQRASQVSTSHHSTSKWILGYLARNGWLYGIKQPTERRRPTRLLEIGAINTELLNVASETTKKSSLQVRAIDLHSMHDGIEEVDFLQMPILSRNLADRYDVLCCSMVLNSVTDPTDRGTMLARLFHHLRPGGLCFLTLPKTCLNLSPYMTPAIFESMSSIFFSSSLLSMPSLFCFSRSARVLSSLFFSVGNKFLPNTATAAVRAFY